MNRKIPDLTFPELPYGTNQVPIDLAHHIYRGLSEENVEMARDALQTRKCGKPDQARLPLVIEIHSAIKSRIAIGQPIDTIRNICKSLRYFFAWCDSNERNATKETVVQDFYAWAEYLLTRTKPNPRPVLGHTEESSDRRRGRHRKVVIKAQTANDIASFVSRAISEALGMTRPLIRYTRLPAAARAERKPYSDADKLPFETASLFGSTMLRICDQLPIKKVLGPLPIQIKLQNETVLTEWCKLLPPENVASLNGPRSVSERNAVLKARKAWEDDRTIRTRFPVVNLRIECELLIFLSQTGMNLAQAHQLGRQKFTYKTKGDDVVIASSYKGRRGGQVKFQIFKEYRPIFKRYLDWIENFVTVEEDDRLFPFYYPCAIPAPDRPPNFSSTRIKCVKLGIEWVGPRKLRNHRVNWIKGYTGSDLIAAESAQHTTQTLQTIYAKPNHATAAREIAKFHKSSEAWREPPAPGRCVGRDSNPVAVEGIPANVAKPDCVNPSGCLFCVFHRDISSKDYVWSLASYRRLKVLEIASYVPPPTAGKTPNSAEIVVGRATEKIDAIASSSAVRKVWVDEALARLREGKYHPLWSASIRLMEA